MNDRDFEEGLRADFQKAVVQTAPASLRASVIAIPDVVPATTQRRAWWPTRGIANMNTIATVAIGAAAVVVVAVFGANLLPPNNGFGGPPASPLPTASASPPPPSSPEPAGFNGLPPEGSMPSSPEPGELVLRWEGSISESGAMWVYADGRMLWWRLPSRQRDAGEAFIGLVEQRLSPAAVEFLRSRVVSTGLFESDLVLAREGNAPFLRVQVRKGDRFVGVTWAWRGITGTAPVATPEQESALLALNTLLIDSASWPASWWEDQAEKAYVPSEYSICFRSIMLPEWTGPTEPIEPSRIWALLPAAAESLILAGDQPPEGLMYPNPNCSRVTTEDARAIARILEDARIERATPKTGEFWLRFLLEDQGTLGDLVWINFEPVLPHGESTWLGPG